MTARIALISEHASPLAAAGGVDAGGQNVYVAHTARHLASLGYRVDVYTRRDDEDLPSVVEWKPGVRVFNVDAGPARFVRKESLLPYMPQFAQRVLDVARELAREHDGYSICHAHFFMSGLVAQRLKAELRVPYVVTFHALGRVRLLYQSNDEFPVERAALEQFVIDHADAVIAECPQDQSDLRRHYRVPPSSLRMIPCGFDPDEFPPVGRKEAREHIGVPQGRPIILQLGRMVPRKGIDTVIRALATLKRQYGGNAMLLVVGGESYEPDPVRTPEIGRLQSIVQAEGLANDVVFVGQRGRDQLHYYYSAADVFVTTPWYEPFGITPLEAMACGVPVIGARVGGVQYSVEDGRTGFLVEPRNPDALARRLAHILSDASIRRLLGKRARRRAYDHFTWAKVSRMLAQVYDEIAAGQDSRVASGGMHYASV